MKRTPHHTASLRRYFKQEFPARSPIRLRFLKGEIRLQALTIGPTHDFPDDASDSLMILSHPRDFGPAPSRTFGHHQWRVWRTPRHRRQKCTLYTISYPRAGGPYHDSLTLSTLILKIGRLELSFQFHGLRFCCVPGFEIGSPCSVPPSGVTTSDSPEADSRKGTVNQSFAFFHGYNLIALNVRQFRRRTAGPRHFDRVHI